MRVLLTGATGQVGRCLLATAPSDAVIHALGRGDLDITDADRVATVVQAEAPDLIINAAAYTAVDKAESEPDLAFAVNRDGARHLAEAAMRAGARLVHISTDFVFDGARGRPYRPTDPTAPIGVYGASKDAGEQAVRAVAPEALILRTAWVYSGVGANFLLTMLRLMGERNEVGIVADQVGTPTHARSLAAAMWSLACRKASGTLHFTDSGVASWYDFAVAIHDEALALGLLSRPVSIRPIKSSEYPTPARRPAFSLLDKTDTFVALGYPAQHWRTELRAALSDMKARQHA